VITMNAMFPSSLRLALVVGLSAAATGPLSAASPIPPGVPEPGLILWGSVVNATNTSQPVQIDSASWTVTDGITTAAYSSATRPAVQIFTQGDQTYYVLEVPFDTRRFGSIQLNDPANSGVKSFPLQSASPPAYLMTPTINGVPGSVRSIDGAPATGTNLPITGFTATVRGRVIRVDLAITPISESFEQWATRIFGSSSLPTAAPGADPDGDGFTNGSEFAAGTNPLDPASVLRLFQVTFNASQATLGWQSVASKRYILESASNANGPWTDAASILAAGASVQTNVPRSSGALPTFYRVRVAP
jgi:hypothetical protein